MTIDVKIRDEKLQYNISSPADTRRPGYVPWRSPIGLNVWDLQGTFRRTPRGPTQKLIIWWKKCFLDAIALVLQIYYYFLLKKINAQVLKVLKGDVHVMSTGPSCRVSKGPNDGRFWWRLGDVGHTCLSNSTLKHIKLTLTGYSRLYSEL